MIDIKKAEKEFLKYTNSFDKKNEKIASKISHTFRVEENSKIIAESLNISEEDKSLAILIGLLHDIGRFEQIKRYDSFNDRSTIDHAKLGVEILKESNYISKYAEEKYWNTIFNAVNNHNKLNIEEGLSKKDLLHSKIVRDADKIDIFKIYIEKVLKQKSEESYIGYNVVEDLLNKKQIDNRKEQKEGDTYLCAIGFIYDINYKISLKIIKENNYINKLINQIKNKCILTEEKQWLEEIRKVANNYIEERLKNSSEEG